MVEKMWWLALGGGDGGRGSQDKAPDTSSKRGVQLTVALLIAMESSQWG